MSLSSSSSISNGRYGYSAHVYKRARPSAHGQPPRVCYDIEVFVRKSKPKRAMSSKVCVYSINMSSNRYVTLGMLTAYMKRKFQRNVTDGLFIGVTGSLDWIESILDVEFDYHVGDKVCTLSANVKYMEAYCGDASSGYGPAFCDT